jgi:hypothetical protein
MDAGGDDQRIPRIIKKTVESTGYSKNGLIYCMLMKYTVPSVAVILPVGCEVLDNIQFRIVTLWSVLMG